MNQNVQKGNSEEVNSDEDSISDEVSLKKDGMKHQHPELVEEDKPVVVVNNSNVIISVNRTAKRLGVNGEGEERQSLIDARKLCEQAGKKLVEITSGERYVKTDTFLPISESSMILDAIQSCPVFQI